MEPWEIPDPARPWVEQSAASWARAASTTVEHEAMPAHRPTVIHFTGPCPACTHEFVYDYPLEVLRIDVKIPTVMCQCSATHTGRPDADEYGCGAYWNQDV